MTAPPPTTTTTRQVVTIRAGDHETTLDTLTVARALRAIRVARHSDAEHLALHTLHDILRAVCGADHLDALLREQEEN